MAKVTGIKGINISKSSVLRNGKKTGADEGTRDTADGTTRDTSKGSGGKGVLDAAMIKMLLGQTELLNKKAQQIEQNMKVAAIKEADRQKREEEYWRKQEEFKEKQKERKFDEAYNKIDNGIVNSILAGFLGPAGVLLGKGLNKAGVPLEKYGKKTIRGTGGLIKTGLEKLFGRRSNSSKEGSEEDSNSAVGVNRREEAARPVNELKATVQTGFDKVLDRMGGGHRGDDKKEEGWLDKLLKGLLPFLPFLGGLLSGYKPLKDFGLKFLIKRFGKAINGAIKLLAKLGGKLWNVIKKPLAKIGGKIWKVLKGPLSKIGSKLWKFIKSPLVMGASLLKGAFGRVGRAIMNSGVGRALKSVGRAIINSGLGRILKSVGNTLLKAGRSLVSKITGKVVSKAGAKVASKVGAKAATKTAAKTVTKAATKGTAKAAGKGLLKKIPGVSTLAGLWFGAERAMKGDWKGAGLEVLSGVLGNFAGLGTAASVGIDAYLLAKDVKRDLAEAKNEGEMESEVENLPQNHAPEVTSEGSYDTEEPSNSSYQMQSELLDKQDEILNALNQIEYNISPEVQKSVDMSYLNNAQRMFDRPPEGMDYGEDYSPISNPMSNPFGR